MRVFSAIVLIGAATMGVCKAQVPPFFVGDCSANERYTNQGYDCINRMLASGSGYEGWAQNEYCVCWAAGSSWKQCAKELKKESLGQPCKFASYEVTKGSAQLTRVSSAAYNCAGLD